MKIETKFDIGKEVYVLQAKKDYGYKAIKVCVKSISITVEDNYFKKVYFVSNGSAYNEEGLFKTRQEALEKIGEIKVW